MITSAVTRLEPSFSKGLICNNPSKEFHNLRLYSYIAHLCCVLPIQMGYLCCVGLSLFVVYTYRREYALFVCIHKHHQTFSKPSLQFHQRMAFCTSLRWYGDYIITIWLVNTPKYEGSLLKLDMKQGDIDP